MGGLSLWHLILLALILSIVLVPISKILRRVGFSGWLAILYVIPGVNLIMLWVFAFIRWPKEPGTITG